MGPTLLPFYAKSLSLLPNPHPMAITRIQHLEAALLDISRWGPSVPSRDSSLTVPSGDRRVWSPEWGPRVFRVWSPEWGDRVSRCMLRKGVLLERTYIHSRRLPLDHSRERPHVSRDPVSLAPRLPPGPAYAAPVKYVTSKQTLFSFTAEGET